jgi:hypothetical protein
LLNINHSSFLVFSDLPDAEYFPNEWRFKNRSIHIIVGSTKEISINSIIPSYSCYIAVEKHVRQDYSQGIQCSLVWHWQRPQSTTIFQHWHDQEESATKANKILKDILKGYIQQYFSTNGVIWMFEEVQARLQILSMLS